LVEQTKDQAKKKVLRDKELRQRGRRSCETSYEIEKGRAIKRTNWEAEEKTDGGPAGGSLDTSGKSAQGHPPSTSEVTVLTWQKVHEARTEKAFRSSRETGRGTLHTKEKTGQTAAWGDNSGARDGS